LYTTNVDISDLSIFIRLECIRGESWIYSTGQKNGLHAFSYNSAESEPIWMKFATLFAKCWWLARADFGRDPCSSNSLGGSQIFLSGK